MAPPETFTRMDMKTQLSSKAYPLSTSSARLRAANPTDILRIGIVAAAAFKHSSVLSWERPYHKHYPEDSLLSYGKVFEDMMQVDDFVIIVAEDVYSYYENISIEAVIPPNHARCIQELEAKR